MFWDHDLRWCINVLGPAEIDYRFSLIQTAIGYRSFDEGVSNLKQVTGRDHRAAQRYIIAVIAGSVPPKFLAAIRSLLDFRYVAQMPRFDHDALAKVEASLGAFHDNKSAILTAGGRQGCKGPLDHWEIPKLKLLQHVSRSIRASGAVIQWTADVTEHAHVTEIKQPARSGNNQDYYSQIARHLDRREKCYRFDLATRLISIEEGGSWGDDEEDEEDQEHDHEPDLEALSISPAQKIINYFEIAATLAGGVVPDTVRPHRIFASSTTALRLAVKPSLRVSTDEVADMYGLPDLRSAITDYFSRADRSVETANFPAEKMQLWFKVRVQLPNYHNPQSLESPQSLLASPPSARFPIGRYDFAIISQTDESDWPSKGLRGTLCGHLSQSYVHHLSGHEVIQVRLIFRLLWSNTFLAYVQQFNVTSPPPSCHSTEGAAGMHILKRAIRRNGSRVGYIIPLHYIRSPAHVISRFGREANDRLTRHTCNELSNEFWLNKYWNKQFFYALSLCS